METTSQLGVTGITENLKQNLSRLLQSSEELREALITRNVDQIWEILSEQEQQMQELEQQNFLWNQLFGSSEDEATLRVKDDLREDILKIKQLEELNGSLSRSFLHAIRKAMKVTGTNMAGKTNVYGRRGKMKLKKSSLMVNKVG